ncbi:hypothetical protein [Kineosporia sp. NBRC 101677]|uniref:hypothetical protein n=1 Tax=Kineosporia sp. NBRC 101677 TaxID=3032197 RepID=UPI0025539CD5|nr:hypothetical protein [Kineosporia sp. NBRC 101677]
MGVTTLSCPACARPLGHRQTYCETCGARAGDPPARPVRRPVVQVPGPRQVHMQEILTPARQGSRGGGWGIGLGLVLVVLLVVAGLTFATLRSTGVVGGPSETERQAAAMAQEQADLRSGLGVFMEIRAVFFGAERRYLPAMHQARVQIQEYNTELAQVEAQIDEINSANAARLRGCGSSCPDLDYPAYPKMPELGPQIKDLKAVVQRTGELHGQLSALRETGVLVMAYSDLLSAVDLLGEDARENLASLKDMRRKPKTGSYADGRTRLRIGTLNGNSSLPVIRRMNGNLVRLLERTDLPVRGYDLPGGRDRDRSDHSTAV